MANVIDWSIGHEEHTTAQFTVKTLLNHIKTTLEIQNKNQNKIKTIFETLKSCKIALIY